MRLVDCAHLIALGIGQIHAAQSEVGTRSASSATARPVDARSARRRGLGEGDRATGHRRNDGGGNENSLDHELPPKKALL
jgi:hypothetical protein